MKDGIYDNISIQDYHSNRTHISATQIKEANKSLKQFRWYMDGLIPREHKPHFDFGNAFELALLDPESFAESVMIRDEEEWIAEANKGREVPFAKPRASAKYAELAEKFEKTCAGKYQIKKDGDKESYTAIEHMLESCHRDKAIQALIANTEYQLSLFWTDPETGIKLKTRPDICKRKKNIIVNLKTTEDGSPAGFSRDLAKYDYPLQACVEISGCLNSGLMPTVDNYFWLVVEKVPPYNATIYEFAETDIAAVMDKFAFILNRLKKAQEQNLYPGYSNDADNQYGILTANIPLWYKF